MGIFDKLFGKKAESDKGSSTETIKQESYDIKDYKLYNIEETELNAIEEYSKYISNILPLYVANLNTTHILHPDNLIRFGEIWFKTEKQNRMVQVEESTMIEYLGVSLGKYVNEIHGFTWCNVADMRTAQNGNVNAECALIDTPSKTLFLPIKVISKEIFDKKGYVEEELSRIGKIAKPNNAFPNDKEMSFEEYVNFVKQSGKGEDVVKIWDIVLNLKDWHFITIYNENFQDSKPFIGVIDDKPWFFVFTNREKAFEYAKSDNRFLGKNGESYIISQSVENSLKMILRSEQNGVFGLRVNENDCKINSNFNIPISVLKQIIQILKDKK